MKPLRPWRSPSPGLPYETPGYRWTSGQLNFLVFKQTSILQKEWVSLQPPIYSVRWPQNIIGTSIRLNFLYVEWTVSSCEASPPEIATEYNCQPGNIGSRQNARYVKEVVQIEQVVEPHDTRLTFNIFTSSILDVKFFLLLVSTIDRWMPWCSVVYDLFQIWVKFWALSIQTDLSTDGPGAFVLHIQKENVVKLSPLRRSEQVIACLENGLKCSCFHKASWPSDGFVVDVRLDDGRFEFFKWDLPAGAEESSAISRAARLQYTTSMDRSER